MWHLNWKISSFWGSKWSDLVHRTAQAWQIWQYDPIWTYSFFCRLDSAAWGGHYLPPHPPRATSLLLFIFVCSYIYPELALWIPIFLLDPAGHKRKPVWYTVVVKVMVLNNVHGLNSVIFIHYHISSVSTSNQDLILKISSLHSVHCMVHEVHFCS
jgi:hypothetical protein